MGIRLSIHQPEHFPYLGFFKKMKESDVFVLLDNVQYKKNNFQNRNRFLNKNEVDEWFTVQIEKGSSKRLINEVRVSNDHRWRNKIIRQLLMNFKIDYGFIYEEKELLIDVNMASILHFKNLLEIDTKIIMASEIVTSSSKTDLLVEICKEVGASTYISGHGGKSYLELEKFTDNLIDIEFINYTPRNYYSIVQNIEDGL